MDDERNWDLSPRTMAVCLFILSAWTLSTVLFDRHWSGIVFGVLWAAWYSWSVAERRRNRGLGAPDVAPHIAAEIAAREKAAGGKDR